MIAGAREGLVILRMVRVLGRMNQVLVVLVPVLGGVFLLDLIFQPSPSVPAIQTGEPLVAPDSVAAASRDFSYYSAKMGRKLFAGKRRSPGRGPGVGVTLEGEAAQLELQGIFMDDKPQALIMDRRTNRSYRVTGGQTIGPVRVQEVRGDGVILFYKGKTLKLSL